MGERIDTFAPSPGGRPRLYPWEDWGDGGAWRIMRGEDFQIAAPNMAALIRAEAHKRGVRATCRVIDEDTVEFQFLFPQPRQAAA
jgi:hypothetical protein